VVAWNAVERDSIFVTPGSQMVAATDSVVTWIDGKRYRILHRFPKAIADFDSVRITSNTGTTFNDRVASYTSSGFLSSFQVAPGTSLYFSPNSDGTGGITTIPGDNRTGTALATHALGSVGFTNLWAFGRRYHYDQAGRINQAIQSQNGPANNPGIMYGYDTLGRVSYEQVWSGCVYGGAADSLSGTTTTCGSLVSTNAFTYDGMGNRTDHGGVPTTGNRYVSLNGLSYTYDGDGNVAMKWGSQANYRQWWWNATTQLDSARKNGWYREKYEYNALGKPVRILYAEGDTPLAVSRYLLWDGDALIAQLTPNGQREVDYAYLPGTIDHPVAHTLGATTPTTVRYHEVDALGNVIGTSQSGVVSQNDSYDAWGNNSVGGNFDSHLLWKGLYWNDSTTGLYYVRNRWYDSEAGRFVSEDPAGFAGGANLYAFAGNDPVNGKDPSGLDAYLDCFYTPGYETTTADGKSLSLGGHWTCYGGGGGDGGAEGGGGGATTGGGFYGGGGGGGMGRDPVRAGARQPDVGETAEALCAFRVLTTVGMGVLDTFGAGELFRVGSSVASALFHVLRDPPSSAWPYLGPLKIGATKLGFGRVQDALDNSTYALLGGAAVGSRPSWWEFLPVPYASLKSNYDGAKDACLSPGPK